jgi:hypothetical protein
MTVSFAFDPPDPDPLGVLSTTAPVAHAAHASGLVRLDTEAIKRFARVHANAPPPAPEEASLHATFLPPRRFCNYLLLLEALNFSFWDEEPRWRVPYRGASHDGYWALAAALHRSLTEDGTALWDARWMASLDRHGLDYLLRGEGRPPPLMAERLADVREAGDVLLRRWDGEFANLIEVCRGDAVMLAQGFAAEFSSFRDEADWNGSRVCFYKRAQIGAADLSRLLPQDRLGAADRLRRLQAAAGNAARRNSRALARTRPAHRRPRTAARARRGGGGNSGRDDLGLRMAGAGAFGRARQAGPADGRGLCALVRRTRQDRLASLSPHPYDHLLKSAVRPGPAGLNFFADWASTPYGR